MKDIFLTFCILKLDKSNEFNDIHPLNIDEIFSTNDVLKLDRFI